MSRELIRVDKNGTKYYECVEPCAKCGGTGYISYYRYYESGVCFDCGGSGRYEYTDKVYTDEFLAKKRARLERKAQRQLEERIAQADERNKSFLTRQGYGTDGKAYMVLGNTYAIKDELKQKGAKFDNLIGWHFPAEVDGYNLAEVEANKIYDKDNAGVFIGWLTDDAYNYINNIKQEAEARDTQRRAESSPSEFVGAIGDTFEGDVTFTRTIKLDVESRWSSVFYIHQFTDANGNELVWKTSTYLHRDDANINPNDIIHLKGKVNKHEEYKGIKQTILKACRVS